MGQNLTNENQAMEGSREDKCPLCCPPQGVLGHGSPCAPSLDVSRAKGTNSCDQPSVPPVARHKAESSSLSHQASIHSLPFFPFPSVQLDWACPFQIMYQLCNLCFRLCSPEKQGSVSLGCY